MARRLVSVVVIFLNAERFLGEAIESVLAQTYPHWELLLVDDGSDDGSTEIAKQYADAQGERIRYLQHAGGANRGMSASRNLGIREARGDYVAFLDADDVYLPQKLERQTAILEAHPGAAMVYGPSLQWSSWNSENRQPDRPRKLGVQAETLVSPPTLVRRFLSHQAWTPATCAVLLRRSAAAEVGGFDERFRGLFEDQAFFYKFCLRWPVYVEGRSWDRYRQHPDQWCERARRAGEWAPRSPNPAHREFMLWLESYLRDEGVRDSGAWRALRRELLPYRHPRTSRLRALAGRLAGRT